MSKLNEIKKEAPTPHSSSSSSASTATTTPNTTTTTTTTPTSGGQNVIDVNSQVTYSAINAASILCTGKNPRSIKTPISLLQEICMKCSIQPAYEMVSTEGQVHEPIFVYKVTVGDIVSVSKGSSKKKAKHAAALSVLNEIKQKCVGKNDLLAQKIESLIESINESEVAENLVETVKSEVKEKQQEQQKETDEEKSETTDSNPIGELIELTQKFSMRPPQFEFGEDEGPPHNKQFTCLAQFGEFTENGSGRSKKVAKRVAAHKLLKRLRASTEFLKEHENVEHPENFNQTKSRKNGINCFNQLKQSNKPTILKLLSDKDFNEDELNKGMFESLAKEENFDFRFYKITQKTKSGLHQVVLQFKINPPIVVHGLGITLEEAIHQASYNALCYIKLACSR